MKKTLIVGATPNTSRYAYMAAERLSDHEHEIVPIGIKKGAVFGKEILPIREFPDIEDVHTITMYVGARHQSEYYKYLLGLKPKRMIFNPGTENYEFMNMAEEQGIEVVTGCTLVMLGVGNY
ncbi:MAG: CoA-binding protein [Bacteroidota bacterium]